MLASAFMQVLGPFTQQSEKVSLSKQFLNVIMYPSQYLCSFYDSFRLDQMLHLGGFHWGWMTPETQESFGSKSTAGASYLPWTPQGQCDGIHVDQSARNGRANPH